MNCRGHIYTASEVRRQLFNLMDLLVRTPDQIVRVHRRRGRDGRFILLAESRYRALLAAAGRNRTDAGERPATFRLFGSARLLAEERLLHRWHPWDDRSRPEELVARFVSRGRTGATDGYPPDFLAGRWMFLFALVGRQDWLLPGVRAFVRDLDAGLGLLRVPAWHLLEAVALAADGTIELEDGAPNWLEAIADSGSVRPVALTVTEVKAAGRYPWTFEPDKPGKLLAALHDVPLLRWFGPERVTAASPPLEERA